MRFENRFDKEPDLADARVDRLEHGVFEGFFDSDEGVVFDFLLDLFDRIEPAGLGPFALRALRLLEGLEQERFDAVELLFFTEGFFLNDFEEGDLNDDNLADDDLIEDGLDDFVTDGGFDAPNLGAYLFSEVFFFFFLPNASLAINRRQHSKRRRSPIMMAMIVPRLPVNNSVSLISSHWVNYGNLLEPNLVS